MRKKQELRSLEKNRQVKVKNLPIWAVSSVTQANAGEGLMFFGNVIIPFRDNFDKTTEIYGLLTTRPQEVGSL
jgi:hypothetical protein